MSQTTNKKSTARAPQTAQALRGVGICNRLASIETSHKQAVVDLLRGLLQYAEQPGADVRSIFFALQEGPNGFRTGVTGHYRSRPIDALPAMEALRRKLRWELCFTELA